MPPDLPPPEEPTMLQVRPTEAPPPRDTDSDFVRRAHYHSSASEGKDLPPPCPTVEEELPPPRPPTPTVETDEIPPPRPPQPTEVYENLVSTGVTVPLHEIAPPRPLPPVMHETAPPRPVPPASDGTHGDELYVCPPPRPDPPSDDADDEREMTPPRPQPPLEYDEKFLSRPSLPTIHESSPPLTEGSPVLEESSKSTKIYAKPPRPKAPIITEFTPPRPKVVQPSPSLPVQSGQAQVMQMKKPVPAEVTPEHSSPSDHPYTSSSPEKSGTSPEKESDGDAATAPLTGAYFC